ncbi:MAG: IS66 family transposase [Pseudomonadales bacterium]|nr:IS66 family transposase [Pseudomonadales bacterium]
MEDRAQLDRMDEQSLRQLASALLGQIAYIQHENDSLRQDNTYKQCRIDQLSHEMALLKRVQFAARSEAFNAVQRQLFEETMDADLAAIACELAALKTPQKPTEEKATPRRAPLPANLPRREINHEPAQTVCSCGCSLTRIGEDVSEKLDYTPGSFTVERHVRGKWVCADCQTLIQAPVPPHVIDKGIPTTGLLAQVLVAKYADHQPLNRQEAIFGRAGVPIPRSTLAQWVGECGVQLQPLVDALRACLMARPVLHADETPVAMLAPGKGKTHRAYVWAYGTTPYDALQAVVYDFADNRAGANARRFLADWSGTLVCDDFKGYKALFDAGVTEAGCLAHARRKFHELWVSSRSPVAEQALVQFAALYDIERRARHLTADERARLRANETQPLLDRFHDWLILYRQKATDGTPIARAIDYSLKRWEALTRFAGNGDIPADNNSIENRIRPIALGRTNWLFAGSLRGGQRWPPLTGQ